MHTKEEIKKAVEYVKANSPKKKFKQKIDLIINLQGLDLKKPEQQLELFVPLPFAKGKQAKVCALVGPELAENAKASCQMTILHDEFKKYTDKKQIKKLAKEYDFFIAQANIMPDIAKVFGRVFGPRGRMPNPKAGCVVPPNANLKLLVEKLQKTVRIAAKTGLSAKCIVGSEEMPDEELAANINEVLEHVVHKLPSGEQNIKSVLIKTTMGSPVRIGKLPEARPEEKKQEKPSKQSAKKKEQVSENV